MLRGESLLICILYSYRSGYLRYDSEVTEKYIKLYRFTIPEEMYLSGDVCAPNKGFCVSPGCLPTGLLNISLCQPMSKWKLILRAFFLKSAKIPRVKTNKPWLVFARERFGEQGWPTTDVSRVRFPDPDSHHMWVEFVVSCLLCSKRFFYGYSGFPFSSKTSISKFQFDLDYCQALYYEPLARVIAQALPVCLTLNLHFTFWDILLVIFGGVVLFLRGFMPFSEGRFLYLTQFSWTYKKYYIV